MRKRIKIVVVAFSLPFIGLSQNTFEQGIGATNLDYAYAVTTLNNSIYIAGANGSFTNQASSSVQVLKLDDVGNKIWEKSIQGGLTSFAVNWSTAITALSTNELLIGGYTDDSTVGGNKDGWVTKLDTNGNVIWSKRYGTVGQDRVFSVLEMNNGDYMVIGYQVVSPSSGGSDGVFMIRIDTSGTIIWNKYFSESATTVGLAFLNGAIITSDDEIVATGFTNTFGAGDYDNFLIKLDANGNTIFYKNYGDSFDNRMYAITELNNDYYLAGKSSSSTGDKACLMKIDSSGNNLWTQYYSVTGSSINDFRTVTNNGTSIIASGRTDASGGGEAMIFKISPSTGVVESGATYGGNALDKIYGSTSNGTSIVGVGSTTSTDVAPSTNGDMFVVKTSINDLSSCSGTLSTVIDAAATYLTTSPIFPTGSSIYTLYNVTTVLIPTSFTSNQTCSSFVTNVDKKVSVSDVLLYPNPANNLITLTLSNENSEWVNISIYNVMGQKVTAVLPLNKRFISQKIEVNPFPKGLYFVKIQIGNKVEIKKLIIE